MRKLQDLLPENKTLHVWLYGAPGTGKTKAAIQVAKIARTLFIAVESGLLPHHLEGIPKENLVLVGPDTMQDLNIIYDKFKNYQDTYYKWVAKPSDALKEKLRILDEWFLNDSVNPVDYKPVPFFFVVVDTLTDVQKDTIIHQVPRSNKDFTATGKMQIQQWGTSNAMLDMITDAFIKQEVPYTKLYANSIWVSHEKMDQDKEGNYTRICPALSGQNPSLIGAKMDVEAYCLLESKGGARKQSFVVQKHGKYRVYDLKDRTDKLGNIMTDTVPGKPDMLVRIMKSCGYLPEELKK